MAESTETDPEVFRLWEHARCSCDPDVKAKEGVAWRQSGERFVAECLSYLEDLGGREMRDRTRDGAIAYARDRIANIESELREAREALDLLERPPAELMRSLLRVAKAGA